MKLQNAPTILSKCCTKKLLLSQLFLVYSLICLTPLRKFAVLLTKYATKQDLKILKTATEIFPIPFSWKHQATQGKDIATLSQLAMILIL